MALTVLNLYSNTLHNDLFYRSGCNVSSLRKTRTLATTSEGLRALLRQHLRERDGRGLLLLERAKGKGSTEGSGNGRRQKRVRWKEKEKVSG